jgi:antirestriction protein ArdC
VTVNQASIEGFTVDKGAKATMISFMKSSDIEAVRDLNGQKLQDENGQTITREVKFEKAVPSVAFLINAEHVKGIKPLEEFLNEKQAAQQLSPVERAEKMLNDSGAKIEFGGSEAYYDVHKDKIFLPYPEEFESQAQFYAVALHEVGHWSGHPDRMNRPMEGRFGSMAYGKEELRAEIASLMLGSELGIGHHFGKHEAYVFNWTKLLKEEPFELFRAAADAQRIFDYMLKLGHKQEIKEEATPVLAFQKNETIPYNGKEYKVLDILNNKNIKVEDNDGKRITVKPKDGLYGSLLEAKNNPVEQQMLLEEEIKTQRGR